MLLCKTQCYSKVKILDNFVAGCAIDVWLRKELGKKLVLNDITKASNNNTSALESFHSTLNRFASKVHGLSYNGMTGRDIANTHYSACLYKQLSIAYQFWLKTKWMMDDNYVIPYKNIVNWVYSYIVKWERHTSNCNNFYCNDMWLRSKTYIYMAINFVEFMPQCETLTS